MTDGDFNMAIKTTALLAAALLVGAASSALASDNAANSGETGGADIGPLGQCFVPPDCGQARGSQANAYRSGPYGFAYVPARPYHHRDWHRAR
jgi:hypothetical protein